MYALYTVPAFFVMHWAEVAQRRMSPAVIVEGHPVHHRLYGLRTGRLCFLSVVTTNLRLVLARIPYCCMNLRIRSLSSRIPLANISLGIRGQPYSPLTSAWMAQMYASRASSLREGVQVVKVDHIGLQASKRIFAGLTDRGRASVNHSHLGFIALVHALRATSAGHNELVAVRLLQIAHQGLVSPKTTERSGIERRHIRVQRRKQYTLALYAGNRCTIGVAEVHAAQADSADGEGAKLS